MSLHRSHNAVFALVAVAIAIGLAACGSPYLLGKITPVVDTSDYNSANVGALRYVPSGSFQYTSAAANVSTVSAFRIGENEITRAQFLAIMGTDPSATTFSSITLSAEQSDPVQQANWYQAIAFCNKLSLKEGLTPVYSVSGVDFSALTYAQIPTVTTAAWDGATVIWTANGYRLPTEMEWTWAAMGATSDRSNGYTGTGTNTTGYTKGYAGSTETAGAQVNSASYALYYNGTTVSPILPVGTKLANELGLHDMSGNVAEWCWDWYADDGVNFGTYAVTGTQTDYRGPTAGTYRCLRGGSWGHGSSNIAVAYRLMGNAYYQNYMVGFRVVRR